MWLIARPVCALISQHVPHVAQDRTCKREFPVENRGDSPSPADVVDEDVRRVEVAVYERHRAGCIVKRFGRAKKSVQSRAQRFIHALPKPRRTSELRDDVPDAIVAELLDLLRGTIA